MTTLDWLIRIAGVLHLGILIASTMVPQVLDWRGELAKLTPLTRQLVWVHGGYIVLMLVAFGVLSITLAPHLTDGSTLARAVTGFIAFFWAVRLVIQFVYFDPRGHLDKRYLKLGYHGLTLCFAYFVFVYGWTAVAAAPAR